MESTLQTEDLTLNNIIPVGNDRCFLCGAKLSAENRTKEHVYPKWLQKKFNLANQSMVLLNSTKIKYHNLTVPCCRLCNEKMSKEIEKPVEIMVKAGYDSFVKMNRNIVFQWLNKLAYGILYKEISLAIDRKNINSGSIYDVDNFKERKMEYLFLKSIICDTKFYEKPYSILVFKIKNETLRYWSWENPFFHTFCMQLNDIGIVANLLDNGCNERAWMEDKKYSGLLEKDLHPIQFLEVCARFAYKCSLFLKTPTYLSVFDKNDKLTDIVSSDINGEVFKRWDQEEYARIFDYFIVSNNYTFSGGKTYKGNGLVATTLFDENGVFYEMFL